MSSTHHNFEGEVFFARRVRDGAGIDIFAGDTNADIRRDRIRAAIKECELENVKFGVKAGQVETYSSAFVRFYGVAL